jgi:YesN/AraC family two-component response regulator
MLLVDDEQNVLNALVRTIRAGMGDAAPQLETFTDPYEALKRCSIEKFDVVISDFRMPRMTGVEFLQVLKEIAPDTVRMILSASTEFDTVRAAINDAGVYRFISKPWQQEDLLRQIEDAFALRAAALPPPDPAQEALRRLEQDEPGLTKVKWGPNGEIIL